jgi:chromate reductase, NAD(P)H dehydrogenase (quinone)
VQVRVAHTSTADLDKHLPGAGCGSWNVLDLSGTAIDWASRPYGKNAFTRKPSAIIGTSPGKIGTAIAQQHLRSILAFCNSPLMNSVEAYVQFERGLITDDGRVTNESTEQFLRQYIEEFAGFSARV